MEFLSKLDFPGAQTSGDVAGLGQTATFLNYVVEGGEIYFTDSTSTPKLVFGRYAYSSSVWSFRFYVGSGWIFIEESVFELDEKSMWAKAVFGLEAKSLGVTDEAFIEFIINGTDDISPEPALNIAGSSIVNIKTSSSAFISGIVKPDKNQLVIIRSDISNTGKVCILNGSSQAAPANRFQLNDRIYLKPGESCIFWYNPFTSRWNANFFEGAKNVQAFVTPGVYTWTKPGGATGVMVMALGSGGGGGAGCKGAANTLRRGGGGGGGGAYSEKFFPAIIMPDTVQVSVPAGGAGGAARSTNGNGSAGEDGSAATFGLYLKADGGAGGPGGTSSAAGGKSQVASGLTSDGTAPNTSSTTGASGSDGKVSKMAGASGGAGGGINTSNATSSGGVGGAMPSCSNSPYPGGPANGGWGYAPILNMPGTAGGGGNSGTTGAAGGGGAAGSGGGGGGASSTGYSGAGGPGGNGFVVVVTF